MGEDRVTPGMARYTVAEAADMLKITTGAVRNRLSRGTLRSAKEDGTVYVFLPADMSRGAERDAAGTPGGVPHPEPDTLTSELRDRLRYVEGQLEAERQAHAEARRIIAGLVERIPAIEAPQEDSEATETAEEATDVLGAERARQETAELITTLHEGMAEERRRREEAERERDELRRDSFARRERRESPETVEEPPDRAEPHSATGGPQEPVWRRWRRRWFGS